MAKQPNGMQQQASIQKQLPKWRKSTIRESLDMSLGGKSSKKSKITRRPGTPYGGNGSGMTY